MTGRKNHPLAARIKRLMQKDEDVGRIAQATPILIGRAMELFLKKLCNNTAACAKLRHARTVTTGHLKAYVLSDDMMDFLNDIVRTAPDLTVDDRQHSHRVKRQRSSISESSIEPRRSVGGPSPPTPPRRRSQTPIGAASLGAPSHSQSDAASISNAQVILTPSLDRSHSFVGTSITPRERWALPTSAEGATIPKVQTSEATPVACNTPGEPAPGTSGPTTPTTVVNCAAASSLDANPQPLVHQEELQAASAPLALGVDATLIPKPMPAAAAFSYLTSPFQQAPELVRPEFKGGVQVGRIPSGTMLGVGSIGVPGMPSVPAEDDDYDAEEGEEEDGEDHVR